jgi:hypothetical protein
VRTETTPPLQDVDPVDVEERVAEHPTPAERHAVIVQQHRLLEAGVEARRAHPAQGDRGARAGEGAVEAHLRRDELDALDGGDVVALGLLGRDGRDRHRNVEQALITPTGGDDDVLDLHRLGCGRAGASGRRLSERGGRRPKAANGRGRRQPGKQVIPGPAAASVLGAFHVAFPRCSFLSWQGVSLATNCSPLRSRARTFRRL